MVFLHRLYWQKRSQVVLAVSRVRSIISSSYDVIGPTTSRPSIPDACFTDTGGFKCRIFSVVKANSTTIRHRHWVYPSWLDNSDLQANLQDVPSRTRQDKNRGANCVIE